MKENNRIEYLDSFRGLAMILVVFCHVFNFVFFFNEDSCSTRLAGALMLPIFFFVSGWFTKLDFSFHKLKDRLLGTLIPTIVMFLVYDGIRMHGYEYLIDSLHGEYKSGYWFPYALVVMNSIHAILSFIFKQKKLLLKISLWIIAIVLVILKSIDVRYNSGSLCQWLSLGLISTFYPFYALGVTAKCHYEWFHKFIENKWVLLLLSVIFLLLLSSQYLGWYRGMIRSLSGLLLVYALFYKNQGFFSTQTIVGRQLSMIGRYTLPIYLVHYFFLWILDLSWISDLLDEVWQESVFTLLAISLAIGIVYASLCVRNVLSLSPLLYRILLGK